MALALNPKPTASASPVLAAPTIGTAAVVLSTQEKKKTTTEVKLSSDRFNTARPKIAVRREANYREYIRRVLKVVSSESNVSSAAVQHMNQYLNHITRHLAARARSLTNATSKLTITSRNVIAAVRSVVTDRDLMAKLVSEGTQAITRYVSSGTGSEGTRKEKVAGVIFPISAFDWHLRDFGTSSLRVSVTAPIFLAAVMEQIAREVLRVASVETAGHKRTTIRTRDVYLGIEHDAGLAAVNRGCGVVWFGAGVVPNIDARLLVKKARKRRVAPAAPPSHDTGAVAGVKHVHHFRSGTVALRDIRRLQTSTDALLLPRQPFERLVRGLGEKSRFADGTLELLQLYVETQCVNLLRDANRITLHASRETVSVRDLGLAAQLTLRNFTDIWSPGTEGETAAVSAGSGTDNVVVAADASSASGTQTESSAKGESGLSGAGFQRLARRAGVKRMETSSCTAALRGYVSWLLEHVVPAVLLYKEHRGNMTVSVQDVRQGLSDFGVSAVGG